MLTATLVASAGAEIPPDAANNPLLQPIDPQNWVDQAELTWDDYTQIRPDSWNDATSSTGSQNQYKTAVILLQFSDQPFLITQPGGTHPFGNPQPGWQPVPPGQVADWFYDYYAVPNQYNGGQTIHGYWMEDSYGKIGVDVQVFGPYTLPGKLHEYGIPDGSFNAPAARIARRATAATRASAPTAAPSGGPTSAAPPGLCGFDNGFYVTAGHDESSTWQEFGEMLYENRDDIPDAFGPPRNPDGSAPLNGEGNPMPNWADTRYVDWTSWKAAANHWPNASGGTSTQAESSGLSVFAHEFSHLRGLPDNYNNPFADNERNFTGYWEMMSRGTFNGPGGTHNRWQVPNQGGSGLGPHHLLHFKNQLGVLTPADQITLRARHAAEPGHRGGAAAEPRVLAERQSRRAYRRLRRGREGGDLAGTCATRATRPTSSTARTAWGRATRPTAWRSSTASATTRSCPATACSSRRAAPSSTPRVWIIDPNPEDIGMIDFYRPDGTPVPVVRGDPRQLNDATFNAGTNSRQRVRVHGRPQPAALLRARQAPGRERRPLVRRRRPPLDGAGPFTRGVALGNPDQDGAPPRLPRLVHLPADEHRPGGDRRVRLRHLPHLGELVQPGLEGHAAERARGGEGRPDRSGAGARAARPADRRRRRADDRHADGDVGGGRDEDGVAHVQRARARHDSGGK